MKISLFLCVLTLSGCAVVNKNNYSKGWDDGRRACESGRFDKTPYQSRFYDGFLFENLRGRKK